ncbi:MAG: DUF2029 domain-containing protein [Luteitalea sp.]|nr:DUF2029 domain-containing protein [Luteitalea sp.]
MVADVLARHRGPAVLGFILFVLAGAIAMSVDVPRTGYGVKSDESTYIAGALSAAYDGDLAFERKDLERFAGLYHSGPEGIFLKRGKVLRIRIRGPFPFVHIAKRQDPDESRLYFGKALIYPLIAAPFVRGFGLNGLLLLHVLLLAIAGAAGYAFLAAQSSPARAAVFTTAFFGASVLPVYGVFLMPEVLNFTLVLVAYFLWLYKEVAPQSRFASRWTDIGAAVLLGIGTYSKPLPIAVLVAPMVALAWSRRRWMWGLTVGGTAVVVALAFFALTAAVSGEFNYQGGDRKTFYTRFPFDAPDATWDARGGVVTTGGAAQQEALTDDELPARFARNLGYFVWGRHFGFVPYFFPGVVAIVAWLLSRSRRDSWRLLTFAALSGSAVLLLLVLPWTWSGGGGPPGNRYFFSAYPALLFLMPPGFSVTPGMIAWIGGALFTAKMLVNPFVAAKFTWQMTEKGPARRLPVEVTMANDLPVRLAQPLRGRVHYGPEDDMGMLLYFLDQNAWPPEPLGMWVSGAGRADIIVRTVQPVHHLVVEAESPIRTVLTVAIGSGPVSVTLQPGRTEIFEVPAAGVPGLNDYCYLMTTHSTEGFIPHLMNPQATDYRNLGAQLRFRIAAAPDARSDQN